MSTHTIVKGADWLLSPETGTGVPDSIHGVQCLRCTAESGLTDNDPRPSEAWAIEHARTHPAHSRYLATTQKHWRVQPTPPGDRSAGLVVPSAPRHPERPAGSDVADRPVPVGRRAVRTPPETRQAPAPPSRFPSEPAACGFYLVPRPGGFTLHMSAGPDQLRKMRARLVKELCGAGVREDVAEAARLVASELVGNAVRLCGPFTPVVVQVLRVADEVVVEVHDPEPAAVPGRHPCPPDNDTAESGRGLWILDSLAPGWSVHPTPFGKQIRCRLPCRPHGSADAG